MKLSTSKATSPEQLVDLAALPLARLPSFGQLAPSKPLEPSREELVDSLRRALEEMRRMCHPFVLAPTLWPTTEWLDNLSAVIRRLASLHQRGGRSTWSCIGAIENRYPTLKLRKGIEALVDRAAKLRPEPKAIIIQRQGIAGNESAKNCFEALRMCRDGKREIASVNWDEYRDILSPASNKSCKDRATQILLNWLRWKPESKRPWVPLEFWLYTIGNRDLLSKIAPPDYVSPLKTARANREKERIKKGNALRQKRHRLRKDRLALSRRLRSERNGLYELVRQELKIIDSRDSTENDRIAATAQLMRYTPRTPEQWRRFFVKKA